MKILKLLGILDMWAYWKKHFAWKIYRHPIETFLVILNLLIMLSIWEHIK